MLLSVNRHARKSRSTLAIAGYGTLLQNLAEPHRLALPRPEPARPRPSRLQTPSSDADRLLARIFGE
jgi:hypothetical protein